MFSVGSYFGYSLRKTFANVSLPLAVTARPPPTFTFFPAGANQRAASLTAVAALLQGAASVVR